MVIKLMAGSSCSLFAFFFIHPPPKKLPAKLKLKRMVMLLFVEEAANFKKAIKK